MASRLRLAERITAFRNRRTIRSLYNVFTTERPFDSDDHREVALLFESDNVKDDSRPLAWIELIEFLLPDVVRNRNTLELLEINISDDEEFNINNLFWKALEAALLHAFEQKSQELTDYLKDKRPEMFVNSPLNYHPKLMNSFVKYCNWKLSGPNNLRILMKRNRSFITFPRSNVFLKLHVGCSQLGELEEQLKPFMDHIILASSTHSRFRRNIVKFGSWLRNTFKLDSCFGRRD